MSGFPGRASRLAFGPVMRLLAKIRNPETQLSAEQLNLVFWQVAGMNGLVPRALRVCTITGGVLSKGRRWLSWDPNGTLADTVFDVSRVGTGNYTWTLNASEFPDKDGVLTQVALDLAVGIPMGTTNLSMACDVNANGFQGTANCFTANTGTLTDPAKFALLLF
jgi:hypothetical protein